LEEILLIEKVLVNLHIVHECRHRQLMGEIIPEKLVEILLFFGHFVLNI
jgi:hypothetical protein